MVLPICLGAGLGAGTYSPVLCRYSVVLRLFRGAVSSQLSQVGRIGMELPVGCGYRQFLQYARIVLFLANADCSRPALSF